MLPMTRLELAAIHSQITRGISNLDAALRIVEHAMSERKEGTIDDNPEPHEAQNQEQTEDWPFSLGQQKTVDYPGDGYTQPF